MRRTTTALAAILAIGGGLYMQPAFAASESEMQFWRSAEQAGQTADYRAYLDRYPDGDFAPLARNRLLGVGTDQSAAPTPAPTTPYAREAALGLSSADKRRIQTGLVARGYDTRGVDGVFGAGTRSALSSYQRASGGEATGYLTADEYAALTGGEINAAAASVERSERGASFAELRDWREAQRIDSDEGYRAYLDVYPNGLHADEALTEIYGVTYGDKAEPLTQRETRRQYQAEQREAHRNAENALGYDSRQRAEVETRLARAGFNPGPADGEFAEETRTAISAYRSARGLTPGRFLDQDMVRRLVEETNIPRASSTSPMFSNGQINPNVAAAVAAGALAVGGALLLDD
ncbi:peptidoglycan-binding domain-containing protein [Pikeienuella sp. HZG-20]|uniref:peptidoglycan-binding domain-containing protein n=1 Tax=Paludibacillus litoralis TaxID=3133267 RepID=UPI0030ED3F25